MRLPNKRAIASWLHIATTSISGLLLLVVAARYLPPNVAGMWFTLQATAAFVMLADLGLGYTLMREVAYSRAGGGDRELRTRHVRTVLKFLLMSFTIALLLGGAIWWYFTQTEQATNATAHETLAHLWLLYLPTALLNLIAIPLRSLLEGSGLLHLERLSAIASHITQTILLLFAAALFGSATLMCLATALASGLNILGLLSMAAWQRHRLVRSARRDLTFRGLLRSALDFFAVSLGAALTKFAFAPILAVSVGAAQLAPIFFAVKIFSALANAVAVLVTSERAGLATLYAEGRHGDVSRLFWRIMKKTLFASLVIGTLAAICLTFFSSMLAGKAYQVPWWVLGILILDFVLNNCASVSANLVNSCNRNPFKLSVLTSGVLAVGLLLLLVPYIGGEAAVVAQLASGALTSYWYNNYQANKTLKSLDHG